MRSGVDDASEQDVVIEPMFSARVYLLRVVAEIQAAIFGKLAGKINNRTGKAPIIVETDTDAVDKCRALRPSAWRAERAGTV